MGNVLDRRLKMSRFESPYHESMLNLLLAADYMNGRIEQACSEYGLSHPQYNILRILRGVHPNGYPCGEIASRMLNRAPDITRRLDVLEKGEYVVRDRLSTDRRVVVTRITPRGLDLLAEMEPRMKEVVSAMSARISVSDAVTLSAIAEKIYADEERKG